MLRDINERISVLGKYDQGNFMPLKFKWRGEVFVVEEITLVSDILDGGVSKRYYSVISQSTMYRLLFNKEREVWELTELAPFL